MTDQEALQLAFRARLATLSVATTGAISMSVVSGVITRGSGSFLTDGLAPGMEVLPADFDEAGTNAVATIQKVAALTVEVDRTLTDEGSGAGKSLTVGLPSVHVLENKEAQDGTNVFADGPPVHRPYWREEIASGTNRLPFFPADGSQFEETGFYLVHLYGVPNTGMTALRRYSKAVRELFAPGTSVVSGSAAIRADIAPSAGRIFNLDGRVVQTVSIPWRAYSTNTVAA